MGVTGSVLRVNGSVVEAAGMHGAGMLEIVAVGERGLPGEVIAVDGDRATIQVYEYTGGLTPRRARQGQWAAALGASWGRACSAASSTACCARSHPRRISSPAAP